MNLLQIKHISKTYRQGVLANNDISLSIQSGEVYGLLGPNGAGKTTLVGQIIGLAAPTSGQILLDGVDVIANPAYARQACSFQPQSQAPIDGLTLRQAVEMIGRMRGGQKREVRQRTNQLFESLQLTEWAGKPGHQLSGGVRRLAGYCMAAVVPGRLVILDEPTNDVDPLRRRLLWQTVRQLADSGSAVLLVTHNVLEAERSVDRLAIIKQGRVAASGTPASLKQREIDSLRLELILEPGAALPELPPYLSSPVHTGRRSIRRLDLAHVDKAVVWAQMLRTTAAIEEFSLGPATLEDIYVRIVGQADIPVPTHPEVSHDLSTALVS